MNFRSGAWGDDLRSLPISGVKPVLFLLPASDSLPDSLRLKQYVLFPIALALLLPFWLVVSAVAQLPGQEDLVKDPPAPVDIKAKPFTESDLGPNVLIVDPSMEKSAIQQKCDEIFKVQFANQFGTQRNAILFKPGSYDLDLAVGFYTSVSGLGRSPEDTVIRGGLATRAFEQNGNVTCNFWRSCENMTLVPRGASVTWAVSQASPMRRMHIRGDLRLFIGGWASGGYLADSKIDGNVVSGSQQQWYSRNCEFGRWEGGVWNMLFQGCNHAPATTPEWGSTQPDRPFTVIPTTPLIGEKPILSIDKTGAYGVFVPAARKNSSGVGWLAGNEEGTTLPIDAFYIAHADRDTSSSINAALASGKNLLLTPGIYRLDESIKVTRPGSMILGLGMATLYPTKGNPVLDISDVDGVKICSILLDAGVNKAPYLMRVGEQQSSRSHAADPICLYDIFCRIGGAGPASVTSAVIINSSDVIGDHAWIWRADHGEGAGWTSNESKNGLVVNGANVTWYGLFVEHFQEYETLWNGENGRVYFYQNEIPYDVPSMAEWSHDGIKGWASYKVADSVKNHHAWGLGCYSYFRDEDIVMDHAIEVPQSSGIEFRNVMTFWLNGKAGSAVEHVINDQGSAINKQHRESRVMVYPIKSQ